MIVIVDEHFINLISLWEIFNNQKNLEKKSFRPKWLKTGQKNKMKNLRILDVKNLKKELSVIMKELSY